MATACTRTVMDQSTRENTEMARRTDKGPSSGLMEKSTKANKITTSSTDKEPISMRMATPTLVVGSETRNKA